ncbi:MAG: lamin tail domain-containing protein [Polyangiaceae bacterium]
MWLRLGNGLAAVVLVLGCSSGAGGGGGASACDGLTSCCAGLMQAQQAACQAQLDAMLQSGDPEQGCSAALQSYTSAGLCGAAGSAGTGGFGGFGNSGGFGAFGSGGQGGLAGGGQGGVGAGAGFGGASSGGASSGGTSSGGTSSGGTSSGGTSSGGTSSGGAPSGGAPSGGGTGGGTVAPPRLLFSEYVEGSSNNKAIEIYNAGTSAQDLANCDLRRYSNGSLTAFSISAIKSGGVLSPGKTFVICHPDIVPSYFCNETTSSINHNGNDAYELVCEGAVQDVFGQIGVDPGVGWGSAGYETYDNTLTRKCSVKQGNSSGSASFNPSTQWTALGIDDFDGLGSHCGS